MLYAELYLKRTTEEHKTGNIETEEYLSFLEEKGIATKQEEGKSYASMNNKLYEVKMENGNLSVEYVGDGEITQPRIKSVIIVSQTRDSIGIKVEAVRMDGGTYYYSIGTSEDAMGAETSSSEATYTFEGLTQGNTYYIKVRAVNSKGEEAEKTISTVMEEVSDASEENVTYKISWKDGKAKVEFSTETNFTIETSKDNSNYEAKNIVEDLNNGDMVYVRLSNGTYSGKEMAVQIADVTKPEITIRTIEVTTQKIEIEVIAKEEESGFEESKPYKYYISSTAEIGKEPVGTNTEGKYVFENLDQNTEYYIKVEREDRAGNNGEGIITAKTELIPRAEEAIKRETKWEADGTVEITLSAGTEEAKEYTIMYSTDRADWKEYSTPIEAKNGDTIYVCLTDGRNKGEDYQMNIIDNEGPEIEVTRGLVNTNSITVNVKATDKVSGLPENIEYNYYIKESTAGEYTIVAEGEESATYKYTGLKAQTTYNVKVTTKDVIGNEGEGLLDATTNEFSLVTGNISFSNATWANKEASIGITNNTEYEMQYKVFETAEEITTEGDWETAEGKTVTIEHLKDGNRVIARLGDGTNVTTYATAEIEDTIKPSIEVEGISEEWTNKNVTLTVKAEDKESGLQAEAYSFDGGANWQAENIKEYEKNTAGIVIQVRDEAGNIATYNTININNIDKEGPVLNVDVETTSKTITVEILSSQDAGIGMEETPTYTYYMATSEAGLESAEGEESTALTKTYAGLTQNTTYYIRIEAKDKLGNISKTDRTVSTGSLDASSDALKISEPTWSNKEATVKITNSAVETFGYSMDYQIVKRGETFDQNANWTNTAEGEVTINSLKDGDTVYARLSDGSNVSGTIQKEIEDTVKPSVEVIGNSTEWTNQNITLTVNATDNESGLQEKAYSFDGGKTWQAENTKEYSQNTAEIVVQVRDEAGNIGTSETIEITKIDKEGPNIIIEEEETTTKSSRINVTGSDAGVGIEETPTYTYLYKKKTEEEYTEAKQTTDTTYTYENLASNTTYNLKVTAVDKLGNIGENEVEIKTGNLLYQVGDITFSETIWNNSKASITMTNNRAEYEMEYQIGKEGAEVDIDGSWTKVTEETKEITGLETGCLFTFCSYI